MMITQSPSKVTAHHLAQNAYVYIRQSTPRQVLKNTESTHRQYDLRRRATALGWPDDRIITIDTDLGQSGASGADRAGFQKLVAAVSMGRAGIVLGLEVSRLARNCSDWHRLLELCSFSGTLILDEDGLYDPTQFNDRLLLGLKGTMSEAELHVLRSRLRGGALNKAKRGAFRVQLPIGLVYDPHGHVILDPDRQVQDSIRLFFTTFLRLGAAVATVRHFRTHQLPFPRRMMGGSRHQELVWGRLGVNRAVHLLHNPRLAGAYVYGRRRHRLAPDGHTRIELLPRDEWIVLIRDAHPGYITWEQFEQNELRLKETAKAYGRDRRHGPPREGPALLQGRVVCGRCGTKMTVRYHRRPEGLVPDYFCHNRGPTMSENPCQVVPGAVVDQALGERLIKAVTPDILNIAIAVEDEIRDRLEETDRLRKRHVERAEYEANLARQRYMAVDPNNRLVADSLEADWNDKIRALHEARRDHEEKRAQDERALSDEARKTIQNLAETFPSLWNDPQTSSKERKRMLALLVEDVTLLKGERITVHVRFRGGATETLDLAIPLNAWQKRSTRPDIVRLIDELLNDHTDRQIAAILNERELPTGAHQRFTIDAVKWVRYNHGLKPLKQRLAERGMVSTTTICETLGIRPSTVAARRRAGRLRGKRYNDNGHWMYAMPEEGTSVDTVNQPGVADPTRDEAR